MVPGKSPIDADMGSSSEKVSLPRSPSPFSAHRAASQLLNAQLLNTNEQPPE